MRQRKLRAFTLLSLLAIIASVLLWPNVAWAHPLGNFTINTLSLVEVSGELVKVRFVGDFAEIPAFQEMREIDSDHDGRVSDEEREAYMGRKAEEIKNGLRLAIDGSPTTLKVKAKELEFRPGEADLSTMRSSWTFWVSCPLRVVRSRKPFTSKTITSLNG